MNQVLLNDPDAADWARPEVTPAQRRTDLIGAIALFLGAILSMALYRISGFMKDPASDLVSLIVIAATMLPLAFRRRWPMPTLIVVAAGCIVMWTISVPEPLFSNIALFMAIYTVGAWSSRRNLALYIRAIVIVVCLGWLVVSMFRMATGDTLTDADKTLGIKAGAIMSPFVAYALIQLLTNLLYFGGAYYFGNHSYEAARERAAAEISAKEQLMQRGVIAQQAVTIERLRIARELHDAVAHHVSVMGVQAGAARAVLDSNPEAAKAALSIVENGSRNAIDELHGLLGALRTPEQPGVLEGQGVAETNATYASLGVSSIPHLIDQAVAGGLPTDFAIIGEPRELSSVTSLNLYRITQESLTNARKHGGPHISATVRLRYLDDAVEVEISNTSRSTKAAGQRAGRRSSQLNQLGAGLGILGMRERVATDGGELHTSVPERGGFVVRARVPNTTTS